MLPESVIGVEGYSVRGAFCWWDYADLYFEYPTSMVSVDEFDRRSRRRGVPPGVGVRAEQRAHGYAYSVRLVLGGYQRGNLGIDRQPMVRLKVFASESTSSEHVRSQGMEFPFTQTYIGSG
jgi:hypothetical protein